MVALMCTVCRVPSMGGRGLVGIIPLSLILGAITAQAVAGQSATTPTESFLLRTSEVHTTLRPTAGPNNVGNCMIVYPDGRVHLELRRQEFFYGPASLASYEGKLPPEQLAYLRSILDSDAIRSLQPLHQPRALGNPKDFGWFTAEIRRPAKVQTVGTAFADPASSEADATAWREAGLALQPLMDWSHSVKSFPQPELQKVPNANSVCGQ
jgi:hypothetical protein